MFESRTMIAVACISLGVFSLGAMGLSAFWPTIKRWWTAWRQQKQAPPVAVIDGVTSQDIIRSLLPLQQQVQALDNDAADEAMSKLLVALIEHEVD